jgi:hypothetical protein
MPRWKKIAHLIDKNYPIEEPNETEKIENPKDALKFWRSMDLEIGINVIKHTKSHH